MTIKDNYSRLAGIHPQNDDLGMLGPVLWGYALMCDHVTEFGVDDGTSTWAWLCSALYTNKTIRSYDIYPDCLISDHIELAKAAGIDWTFECRDTLAPDFEIDETDLLFIDTEHNYTQLLNELHKHGDKAKKFLMFHDTYTYGAKSYNGYDKGLRHAIDEWAGVVNADKTVWVTDIVFDHSNGLTVLKRVG